MQNIPNYAWEPHKTNIFSLDNLFQIFRGTKTKAEAETLVPSYVYNSIDGYFNFQINDTIHLSIYNSLRNTTNSDIQGLARDRIPSGNTQDKTLVFLIALIHEKHLGILPLIEKVKSEIIYTSRTYTVSSNQTLRSTAKRWTRRADKIADLTMEARAKVGNFAAYADFIRDWALIDLGESIGVQITTTGNSIKLGYNRNRTLETSDLAANQTIMMVNAPELKLPPVGDRTNQTDGITVTAKNGASFYNIKDSAGNWSSDTVLATDTSRTFTVADLTYGVRTRYIAVPTVFQEIQDQTLAVAVVQSVSLDMVFQGTSLTTTVTSSNEAIATAVVTRDGNLAVTGVAAGTATMTVTVTNPSGSVSTTFDVTVTEASGD